MSASEDSDSSSFGPIHPDFIKLRESLDVLVEKLVSIDNKLNIVIDKVEEALNTGVRVKLPVFPLASKERVLIVRERAKEENFRMALRSYFAEDVKGDFALVKTFRKWFSDAVLLMYEKDDFAGNCPIMKELKYAMLKEHKKSSEDFKVLLKTAISRIKWRQEKAVPVPEPPSCPTISAPTPADSGVISDHERIPITIGRKRQLGFSSKKPDKKPRKTLWE